MTLPVKTDGNDQDVEPTIPDPSDDTDVNNTAGEKKDAEANPEDAGKDAETLKQERKVAVQEAIKSSKVTKQTQAKLSDSNDVISVLKDNDKIIDIYNADPAKGERIAQEAFGMNYAQLFEETEEQTKPQNVQALIKQAIREEKEAEKRVASEDAIENTLVDFFVDNKIKESDTMFRKIRKDFNEYSPKNATQAKKILHSIYADYSEEAPAKNNNAPNLSSRKSTGKIDKSKEISSSFNEMLKERGYTPQQIKDYESKNK